MLNHLSLKNFVIVEALELELHHQMTALTGETGAGKSIAIDALQIALGARADSSIVRFGAEQADITAIFDISRIPCAEQWLQENDCPLEDSEVILRRVITKEGRSRQFINGQACTQQQLRDLSEQLVSLHGQHEHQRLLKKDMQRHLLDSYGRYPDVLNKVKIAYQHWLETHKKIQSLEKDTGDNNARVLLLQHYVTELQALAMQPDELQQLEAEHKTLAHSTELIENIEAALVLLERDTDTNAYTLTLAAQQKLTSVITFSSQLPAVNELLNTTLIQLQEAAADLQHIMDNLEIDPERLQYLEQRLSAIYALARKHHITPEQILKLQTDLEQQLAQLENADTYKATLLIELQQHEQTYYHAAQQLTKKRSQTAKILSTNITEQMQVLGMQGGKFTIELQPLTQHEMSLHGNEQVEFMVSANPGHPLQPLHKVASGGELSRISLAVQMLTAQQDNTPTLIFDEVDSGIGGSTAEIVGKLLRSLSEKTQVICITHLAQVAAQAHHHWQVQKEITQQKTKTTITILNHETRIHEIARMIGGTQITQQTLQHAAEMLAVK